MPISVVLQTIEGKVLDRVVSKKSGALNRILPIEDRADSALPMLSLIDPYSNTIFNGLQMKAFIPEWDILILGVCDIDDKQTLREVLRLAERCRREPHTYLRFIGD